MAVIQQLIMNSIISGSIYALMAAGFSLMYAIQKFMNLAHGATYLIGAFSAFALARMAGLPYWISFTTAVILAMLTGLLINELVFSPLRKINDKENALLLSSFGAFLLIEALVLMIFGADVKSFGLPVKKGLVILGAVVTPLQIIIILTAPVIFLVLWLFLKKTRFGKALRATSDNEIIASTMGINVRQMRLINTIIGSGLAGFAGILVALEQNLEHSMGMSAVLKGLTAAVIGGIGNVPAAIIGGYLLGFAENFGIWYLPSGYKDAIAFGLLIIFLLFRPQGFFGTKKREEVSG